DGDPLVGGQDRFLGSGGLGVARHKQCREYNRTPASEDPIRWLSSRHDASFSSHNSLPLSRLAPAAGPPKLADPPLDKPRNIALGERRCPPLGPSRNEHNPMPGT